MRDWLATFPFYTKMTDDSIHGKLPDVVNLADGIEVIDDPFEQPTVETTAGRVGMLLEGESTHIHLIEQPPWLYLDEYGHHSESIVVTLQGEWVVNSQGKRHHLTFGSVFRFEADATAGFEVLFSEPATILVFANETPRGSAEQFVKFLIEHANEVSNRDDVFPTFADLPADHPAVEFARSVNGDLPDWFPG